MNQLQMLKTAMIAYVTNSAKAIWSAIAHPLAIVGSKKCNLKDYKIYGGGKNLLDVKELYPNYANNNGGITLHSGQLYAFSSSQKKLEGVFKENTRYTFSLHYNISEDTETAIIPQIWYTDGTRTYMYIGVGAGQNYIGEGEITLTSYAGKTVSYFNFTYGTNAKRFEAEFSNMQIEEGATATEYEPPLTQATITARGKNYFNLAKVPFNTTTTQAYKNGLIAKKVGTTNRGKNIPISIPSGKTIKVSLDVVDSYIAGTSNYVALGIRNNNEEFSIIWIPSNIGHIEKTITLSQDCTYIQFYFMYPETQNAPGDYVAMDNIMFRVEGDGVYEPYIEPQTIDIFLDEPLCAGEVIQQSVDGLPNLPQFKGTTIYEVQANTPPSGIEVCYYG